MEMIGSTSSSGVIRNSEEEEDDEELDESDMPVVPVTPSFSLIPESEMSKINLSLSLSPGKADG